MNGLAPLSPFLRLSGELAKNRPRKRIGVIANQAIEFRDPRDRHPFAHRTVRMMPPYLLERLVLGYRATHLVLEKSDYTLSARCAGAVRTRLLPTITISASVKS